MTEHKCGSAKSCKYGDMCKPNFNIGACSHYKAEEPQTNEEWLKSKDTSDLAEWIYNAMFNKSCQEDVADGAYMQMMTKKDYIESWLCEVHHAD